MARDNLEFTGIDQTYHPEPGGADSVTPGGTLAFDAAQGYADLPSLLDQLKVLDATTNLFVGELEKDLQNFSLIVTDQPVDAKLRQANEAEWPSDLGPPKNVITYRYYDALATRGTSSADYIRSRYKQAAQDVTGTNSIDLLDLTKLIKNESGLVKEFVTVHVGTVSDSSEKRVVELLQDWTGSAINHTGNLRNLFQKRNQDAPLPEADMDQVSPDDARNSQALFKVTLNKVNIDLQSTFKQLQKNFSDYAGVFYHNFLGPSLSFRTNVTRKVYPILPGRLGQEVNIATNALDGQLATVLADMMRRNNLFDSKMNDLENSIAARDNYRSFIRQLATKGSDIPTGAGTMTPDATDTPDEITAFEQMIADAVAQTTAATPSNNQFQSPHASLSGLTDDGAHPQYLLTAGGMMEGNLYLDTDVTLDNMRPSTHEHSGEDGTVKIHGANIEGGSLPASAVDTSQTPVQPQDLKVLSLLQSQMPPGVAIYDAVLSWEGDPGHTFEVQISPLRSNQPQQSPSAPPPPPPSSGGTTSSTGTTPPAPSGVGTAALAFKPVLTGLLDRQGVPDSTFSSVITAYVVKANWSDLQPTQGGPIATNNVIDQAIKIARQKSMRIKVRVYCGSNAPDWAKNIGGAPFTMQAQNTSGIVGRWWHPDYIAAYADLQQKLQAKYDDVSVIAEVVISGTGSVFAEPLQRDTANLVSITSLLSAGFTVDADNVAIRAQIDAHQVWKKTRSSMDFTPYQKIAPDGTKTLDEVYTETIIDYFRSQIPTGVIGNNSIRSTTQVPEYGLMYQKIKKMGPPMYFQTATAQKIGDWAATLQWAIGEGANYVELPVGYTNWPLDQLAQYAKGLQANPKGP